MMHLYLFSYVDGNHVENGLDESDNEYDDEPSLETEDFEYDDNKL